MILKNYFYSRVNKKKNRTLSNFDYLNEGIGWLWRAQNSNIDGGIPAYYSTRRGYSYSYPETSGYILVTLSNVLKIKSNKLSCTHEVELIRRRIVQYLLLQQNKDGGWGHPGDLSQSMVFDTCQILEGLGSLIDDVNFAAAALQSIYKAKFFLNLRLNSDGHFQEVLFPNKSYAYQARSAAVLIELGEKINDSEIKNLGKRAVDQIFRQKNENGFYRQTGNLLSEKTPITHFVAYTLEGILRAGIASQDSRLIESVKESLQKINNQFHREGSLGLAINKNWKTIGYSQLLSGLCQFSLINWRLYYLEGKKDFRKTAIAMNDIVKISVDITSDNGGIRGGVKSCLPVSRSYYPNCYLNWALKFFLDAVVEDIHDEQ